MNEEAAKALARIFPGPGIPAAVRASVAQATAEELAGDVGATAQDVAHEFVRAHAVALGLVEGGG